VASAREHENKDHATHVDHEKLKKLQHRARQVIEQVHFEVALAMSLRHTNIASTYGVFDAVFEHPHSGIICVLMEYADRGSLANYIWLAEQNGGISFSRRTRVALEMVNGVEYLHSKKIIHEDLKPENILLFGSEFHAKIADFCVFRYLESTMVPKEALVFSPKYVAPELLLTGLARYTGAVDIFSLAMLFYEMFTMEHVDAPPMGATVAEISAARKQKGRPVFPSSFWLPASLKSLIERGWAEKPQDRPSLGQFRDALNYAHVAIIHAERSGIGGKLAGGP